MLWVGIQTQGTIVGMWDKPWQSGAMACGEIDLMQAIPRFHRPRRAHPPEVVEAAKAFWRSEKVSRASPNARDEEAGGRILEVTKVQAHQIYVDHMDSTGMSAMGYTSFLRARPPEVRVGRHSEPSRCRDICENARVG